MKLYCMQGCPFAHRASIALREKHVDFEPVFFSPGKRPTELDAIGPHAKSPTLVDGDRAVWDSQIVVEYIDERFPTPPLFPPDAAGRADARMLAARADRELGAKQGVLVMELVMKPADKRDEAEIAEAKRDIAAMLPAWNDRLAGRDYLLGTTLGFADITLFAVLDAIRRVSGIAIPAELPHLHAWYARIAARPSAPLLATG
jgi:glutathione S-transferase